MALSYIGIKGAKPRAKPYELADREGLFIEVLPSGSKVFRFRYRLNGRREKVTIGTWVDHKEGPGTLAWARSEHTKFRGMIVAGKSPAKARRDEVANAGMDDSTFGGFVEHRYLPDIRSRLRRPEQNERRLERHLLPTLKNRLLSEIDASDLLAILDPLKNSGRVQEARQTLILAKGIFGLAVMRQKILRNPARDIPLKMIGPAGKRDRPLTVDELGALFSAMSRATFLGRHYLIAFELMLLTLCRKGELINAEWAHIDFDKAEWNVPGTHMKNGEAHTVPLSPRAVALFSELKDRAGGAAFVLPALIGRRDKPMSKSGLNTAMKRLTHPRGKEAALLNIPHFVLHDFRSTGSTLLNDENFSADWIEKSLSHAIPGIRGKYARSIWLNDRRMMLSVWADFLTGLASGNVIPLRPARVA